MGLCSLFVPQASKLDCVLGWLKTLQLRLLLYSVSPYSAFQGATLSGHPVPLGPSLLLTHLLPTRIPCSFGNLLNMPPGFCICHSCYPEYFPLESVLLSGLTLQCHLRRPPSIKQQQPVPPDILSSLLCICLYMLSVMWHIFVCFTLLFQTAGSMTVGILLYSLLRSILTTVPNVCGKKRLSSLGH